MTAMPEAKLAREAELPYAIVGMVTDYDCWHDDHDSVTVDAVIKVMTQNAANARRLIQAALRDVGYEVLVASDGAKALSLFEAAKAEGRPIEVVILDLTIAPPHHRAAIGN